MNQVRQALRMSLGGAVFGSFLGMFVGGLLGGLCGCLLGDVSLGLDGALLGGGAGCLSGAIYGISAAAWEVSTRNGPSPAVADEPGKRAEDGNRPHQEAAVAPLPETRHIRT